MSIMSAKDLKGPLPGAERILAAAACADLPGLAEAVLHAVR